MFCKYFRKAKNQSKFVASTFIKWNYILKQSTQRSPVIEYVREYASMQHVTGTNDTLVSGYLHKFWYIDIYVLVTTYACKCVYVCVCLMSASALTASKNLLPLYQRTTCGRIIHTTLWYFDIHACVWKYVFEWNCSNKGQPSMHFICIKENNYVW